MGYRRAGFSIIGVDSSDHTKSFSHVGEFHQIDWRIGLDKFARYADVIHASPPCQRYSQLTKWGRPDNVDQHPDLIEPLREALKATGKPYIIEKFPRCPNIAFFQRRNDYEAKVGLTIVMPSNQPSCSPEW
jgi:hypothetical protein